MMWLVVYLFDSVWRFFSFSRLELVRTKYKRIRSFWTPELWLTLTWKTMTRQQTVSYQFMTLPLSVESRLIICQTQVRAWYHQHYHRLPFKEILSNVEFTGTLFDHFKFLIPGSDYVPLTSFNMKLFFRTPFLFSRKSIFSAIKVISL